MLVSQHFCVSAVLQQPNTMSVTKKFNYKLVKSGNVILTATSDLKGYIVGQAIQLRTDIENKSGRDTGPVVASLLQVSIQKCDSSACVYLCYTCLGGGGEESRPLANSVSTFLGKKVAEHLAYTNSVRSVTMGDSALQYAR